MNNLGSTISAQYVPYPMMMIHNEGTIYLTKICVIAPPVPTAHRSQTEQLTSLIFHLSHIESVKNSTS